MEPRILPSFSSVRSIDELERLPDVERIAYVQGVRISHRNFAKLYDELVFAHSLSRKTANPPRMVIVGHSRSGKTTLCNEFGARHPTVRNAQGIDKVPALVLSVPPHPTVKALETVFLTALGDPQAHRGTRVQMFDRIVKLMIACFVGITFIDELQNLVDDTGKATEYESTVFLRQLIDAVNIPFVTLGTHRATELFSGNDTLRGRFQTPRVFERYDFDVPEDAAAWTDFVYGYSLNLTVRNVPDFRDPKMSRKLWYGSAGTPGQCAKFLCELATLAIRRKADTITLEMMSEAFRNTAWPEIAGLLDPFERGVDVSKLPLPEIRADYEEYVTKHTDRKRTRDEAAAFNATLKKQTAA